MLSDDTWERAKAALSAAFCKEFDRAAFGLKSEAPDFDGLDKVLEKEARTPPEVKEIVSPE